MHVYRKDGWLEETTSLPCTRALALLREGEGRRPGGTWLAGCAPESQLGGAGGLNFQLGPKGYCYLGISIPSPENPTSTIVPKPFVHT